MTEVEQPPPQNGIDLSANEDDDHNKSRPADIEQDMREMERRKRVEAIMGSKLFREELERIVDSARDGGGTSGILQQLSDIVGLPAARIGSTYKASNCLMPINDIRGVESMGYAKGEKILRCKLAATFRLLDLYGWTQGLGAQITARLKVDQEYFLVNPYGLLYHEITASSLNKVDMQGNIVEQGTTNFGVNKSHFVLHSVVHAARPDIRCAIYIGCSPVVAVSTLKAGLLPITRDACVLGEITTHAYTGLLDNDERDRLIRNLGPNSKVMLLTNHGALCCGETIEEAFYAACHIVQACETQLKLLPVGLDNLSLIPEESRKAIYEQARRPPEDLEKKFAAVGSANDTQDEHNTSDVTAKIGQPPKWRVGGAEFEALMRMLDNAGYRTGYIYRHPLIKSDPPKPKNDVELPPAVSSLGYLLEEEELFRQGIWKKGDLRKGGDRSRWLNSPNVYQKVEVLETGTPDPKKITKWVADGSPSHSTPVRIEDPLQFVPAGTNPKEFKRLQQQIKDNRRADKISAGPQSHILEGVTWDEANRIRDANVSATGDHVVLMGAASKGIIQRGFQHNATVYKAPYAKNPFDNVTDDELNEYKRTVERKKKSIHGEYTDTDFSESEALSSLPPGQQGKHGKRAGAQSEPEDMGAHQVMRIETQQAPVPSQPEVVLSDATLSFINGERSHTAVNRKPPTGREIRRSNFIENTALLEEFKMQEQHQQQRPNAEHQLKERKSGQHDKASQANEEELMQQERRIKLIQELRKVPLFQKQKDKFCTNSSEENEEQVDKDKDKVVELVKKSSTVLENELVNNDSSVTTTTYDQQAPEMLVALSEATTNWPRSSLLLPFMAVAASTLQQKNTNTQTQFKYTRKIELNSHTQFFDTPLTPHNTIESNIPKSSNSSDNSSSSAEPTASCSSMNICSNYFNNENYSNDTASCTGASLSENVNKSTQVKTIAAPAYRIIYTGAGVRRRSVLSQCNNFDPYRTVSHFGFNSPRKIKQPEHKHIPSAFTFSKSAIYKPLRKSRSLGEVFSSPRFIEFCDSCFEKALRSRPYWQRGNSLPTELDDYDYNENNVFDGDDSSQPIYDYVYANRPLEPLIEVDEAKIVQQQNEDKEHCSEDSSFLDKIMRMNYSEESANVCFTPHPVTSTISIDIGNDETARPNQAMHSCSNVVLEDELNIKMKSLHLTSNVNNATASNSSVTCETSPNDNTTLPTIVCITEILDFGDWQKSTENTTNEECEDKCEATNSKTNVQEADSDLDSNFDLKLDSISLENFAATGKETDDENEVSSTESLEVLYTPVKNMLSNLFIKVCELIKFEKQTQRISSKQYVNQDTDDFIDSSPNFARQASNAFRLNADLTEIDAKEDNDSLNSLESVFGHLFGLFISNEADDEQVKMNFQSEECYSKQSDMVEETESEAPQESKASAMECAEQIDYIEQNETDGEYDFEKTKREHYVEQEDADINTPNTVFYVDQDDYDEEKNEVFNEMESNSYVDQDIEIFCSAEDILETTISLFDEAIPNEKEQEKEGEIETPGKSEHIEIAKSQYDEQKNELEQLAGFVEENYEVDEPEMTQIKEAETTAQKASTSKGKEKWDYCVYVDQETPPSKEATEVVDCNLKANTNTNILTNLVYSPIVPLKLTQINEIPAPLMSRDERFRRKSEFHELWEDHIAFFKGKKQKQKINDDDENNNNKNNNNNKPQRVINLTFQTEMLDEEVFYGRSSIVYWPPKTAKETTDEDVEDDRESSTTFSVFQQQSSTENECGGSETNETFNAANLFELKAAYNLENDMKRFNCLQQDLFKGKTTPTTSNKATSDDEDCRADFELDLNDQERAIIKGIRDNNLKKRHDGEIFAKIENTIINKLTPRRIAELLSKQRHESENSSDDSTPRKPIKTRRSRSRQIRRYNRTFDVNDSMSTPNANTIAGRATTPQARPQKISKETAYGRQSCSNKMQRSASTSSTSSSATPVPNKNQLKAKPFKRDFIRENIKNASKTRFRQNVQQSSNTATPANSTHSSRLQHNHHHHRFANLYSSQNFGLNDVPDVEVFNGVTSTSIYPFQSKIVHGSPCLWVSLSPQRCKSECGMKKPKPYKQQLHTLKPVKSQTDDELPSCSKKCTPKKSLDLELNALTNQVNEMNTRIESIKRKDIDYAENLKNCSNIVDECIILQQEVAIEQDKLHKDIALNQYAEEIMCRTQTYSLSVTED